MIVEYETDFRGNCKTVCPHRFDPCPGIVQMAARVGSMACTDRCQHHPHRAKTYNTKPQD